ncbi:SET domain protein [Dictyocaulus viviparus]|uniref:SET domain protein n=1 Tax=Dictyocaulus viviparus TaxID=29172 RepID=A0A0D8Y2Q5_DICVI|nr:SET domain protein [Dictyocaulus viviparus]
MICQDIGVEPRTCSEVKLVVKLESKIGNVKECYKISFNKPQICIITNLMLQIYRLAAQLAEANPSLTSDQKKVSVKDKHRSFRSFTWADGKGQVENKERMVPCSHPGQCDGNWQCVCSSASGICSKFCGCPPDCRMRFPGCRCAPERAFTFDRKHPSVCELELSLDLTTNTPLGDEQRPLSVPDKVIVERSNVSATSRGGNVTRIFASRASVMIYLWMGKNVVMFHFNVAIKNFSRLVYLALPAGVVLFKKLPTRLGDLIAEYTGEVISKWESERRGLIYDKFCTSYIFGMNNDQFIDATRVGNLIRFANHSNISANCSSEIKIVNGEHRIGVYASRHILCGEELLFDYNYGQTWNKFVPIEKNIKAHANRSTPDSDSSRTAGSQNKPDKLRRSLLKKMIRAEQKSAEEVKNDKFIGHSTTSVKSAKQRGRPRIGKLGHVL